MKIIRLSDLEYPKFEAIRDAIIKYIPKKIMSQTYSKKLKIGIFRFLDSRYVPSYLEGMANPPIEDREAMNKLNNEISEIDSKF